MQLRHRARAKRRVSNPHLPSWKTSLFFLTLWACAGGSEPDRDFVSLQASPPRAVVYVGDQLEIRGIAKDAQGDEKEVEVEWISSHPGVAEVDALAGIVTGIFPGSASVEARLGNFTAGVEVEVLGRSTMVRIEPAAAILLPGDSLALEAIAVDPRGALVERPVSWISSNPAIATVSDEGVVEAKEVGEVEIVANVDGVEASAPLQILTLPPASVEIEPAEAKVEVGGKIALRAVVRDRDGGVIEDVKVTWESSSATVAYVGPTGLVTVMRPARSEIIARVGDLEGRAALQGTIRFVEAKRMFNAAGEQAATCGVMGNGTVHCWGDNTEGQLGDGSRRSTQVPLQVKGAPPLARIEIPQATQWRGGIPKIFTGITPDGKLYAWGQGAPEGGWIPVGHNVFRRFLRTSTGANPDGMQLCDWTTKGALLCKSQAFSSFWQVPREGHLAPPGADPDPEPLGGRIVEVAGADLLCWRYEDGGVSCRLYGDGQVRTIAVGEPVKGLAGSTGGAMCGLGESGTVYCWKGYGLPMPLMGLPVPLSELFASQESEVCGRGEGRLFCWTFSPIPDVEDTDWLGGVVEWEPGGPPFSSIDLVSKLAFDEGGALWELTDPPKKAPGQE